jgi:hypothetical protein
MAESRYRTRIVVNDVLLSLNLAAILKKKHVSVSVNSSRMNRIQPLKQERCG